jgi:hypothetical protein
MKRGNRRSRSQGAMNSGCHEAAALKAANAAANDGQRGRLARPSTPGRSQRDRP